MRDTLFRGKVYHYGNDCGWFYGDLHHYYNGSFYTIISSINDEKFELDENYVDAGTVGQWTGLIDKNGKKIFEGDILIDRDDEGGGHYPVVFDVKTGSYCIDNSYYKNHSHLVNMVQFFGDELEVVGNIIDNKEMLPKEVAPGETDTSPDGLPF